MKFLNEMEIDEYVVYLQAHNSPVAPYAQALSDWRDTVNENSDGWPYWTPAIRAADKLITYVDNEYLRIRFLGVSSRSRDYPEPTARQLKLALEKVQKFANERGLPAPEL